MSINSFNSLPSILPSGNGEALGGAKVATTGTQAAPNGQEFSVYFERMMHPAFSQAAALAPAQVQDTSASNVLSQSSFSALHTAKDTTPSALSSSLLDPHSSTLAFSHDYLKTKASVADLKLNVPHSNVSDRRENIAKDHNAQETSSASKKRDNSTSRAHSTEPSNSSEKSSSHSTLERLQKRADQGRRDAQSDANDKNTSEVSSNLDAQGANDSSNSDPRNASESLTKEQKLALADQNLAGQRLPSLPAQSDPSLAEAPNAADASTIADTLGALQGSDMTTPDVASNLKTVALGDQTQIITTQSAPNEKSLADFARSMGFDEAQIAALFGPHAAQTLISGANSNKPSNISLSLSAATGSVGASNAALTKDSANASMLSVLTLSDPSTGTASNPLSKLPSTTINSALGLQTPTALDASMKEALATLTTQNALAGSLRATNTTAAVSSSASLSSADNLAQLLNAEGVDPQSVQLNISGGLKNAAFAQTNMPGASNPGLAPTSTLAVLNMAGSQLSEHAIVALHEEFKLLKGEDPSSAFSVSLSQDNALLSGAQLNASDAGGNSSGADAGNGSGGSQAPNAQAANAGSAVNMAETYEKLSNQLTAELSKRMHEQISQGQWKMKFALKPNTLGTVDVQLEMKDGKLAAVFQADNALTQNLLQHSSQQLKDNLKEFGLEQTYVQVDQQNEGQSQPNDQQNNGKNPFEPLNETPSIAAAQDSTPVVDASMKVKNNDSLLDLMA